MSTDLDPAAAWLARWVTEEAAAVALRRIQQRRDDAELLAWVFSVVDWVARDFAALVLDARGAPAQAALHRDAAPLRDVSTARRVLPLLDASMTVARIKGANHLFLGSAHLAVEVTISLATAFETTQTVAPSSISTLFGPSAALDMALYRGIASGAPKDVVSRRLSARVAALNER